VREKVILIAAFIFCVPAAHAGEEWDFAKPHKDRCDDISQKPCMNSPGTECVQQRMNACLANEYKKTDARLNADYKALLSVLEDPSKLKKAQNAWLRFRNLTCDYETSGVGTVGTLYPTAEAACYIDVTEKRIRDLQQYLRWECNGCPPRKQ
jgi:uncharacterized protein YecT (DUF1311 family)